MSTELDLYALRQLTPLECAQRLTELSTTELRAICSYLALRHTKRADKTELVSVITAHLHQTVTPPTAAAEGQQLSMF